MIYSSLFSSFFFWSLGQFVWCKDLLIYHTAIFSGHCLKYLLHIVFSNGVVSQESQWGGGQASAQAGKVTYPCDVSCDIIQKQKRIKPK